MQFPEHEHGKQINHPKLHKLDKLARLLNVTIHIDGVAYGSEELSENPVSNAAQIAKDYVIEEKDEIVTKVSDQVTIAEGPKPVAKKRGRPKKSD